MFCKLPPPSLRTHRTRPTALSSAPPAKAAARRTPLVSQSPAISVIIVAILNQVVLVEIAAGYGVGGAQGSHAAAGCGVRAYGTE